MAENDIDAPRPLDRLKARLLRAAAVWLLLCLALAGALTWQRVQDNRQDVLRQGSQRLQAFSDSVDTHFRALAALRKSPLALDIYTWASWRVSYLGAPVEIPWAGLAAQFGSDYRLLRQFKHAFLVELRKVQLVFPLRITETESGLRLLPGPTSIRKLSKPVDK